MMRARTLFLICGLALMSLSAFAAYPIFDSPVLYPVGQVPTGMVAVDLDNDGDLDLATADSSANTVSILINDGTGIFSTASSYATGEGPVDIAAGDINGDGLADLVTANYTANTLSVLFNAGSGSFPTSMALPIGDGPSSVAVEQLNDAGLDIIAGKMGSSDVSVVFGNGDGTFQPRTDYPFDDSVACICTGDFDLDGYVDFHVGSPDNHGSVFMNDQTGVFPNPDDGTVAAHATDIAAGDFDADGYLDLAFARLATYPNLSFAHNDSEGFHDGAMAYIQVPGKPLGIVCSDFNSDGFDDVAATSLDSGSVRVCMNRTRYWYDFHDFDDYPSGAKPRAMAAGDFDLDGDIDLAVANSGSNDVAILFNYYCGDLDQDHKLNLADITDMIGYVYLRQDLTVFKQIANVDGSADGKVNLSDITYLVSHVYLGGLAPRCTDASYY